MKGLRASARSLSASERSRRVAASPAIEPREAAAIEREEIQELCPTAYREGAAGREQPGEALSRLPRFFSSVQGRPEGIVLFCWRVRS